MADRNIYASTGYQYQKSANKNSEGKIPTSGKAAMGVGAAIQGFADGYADWLSKSGNAKMLAAQAFVARSNSKIILEQAETQKKYLLKATSSQGFDLIDNMNKMVASQNAAQASSGFAKSAGDERLEGDTKEKYHKALGRMRQDLSDQSYEIGRQAASQASALQSQARIADMQSDMLTSGWSKAASIMTGVASAVGTAGAMYGGAAQATASNAGMAAGGVDASGGTSLMSPSLNLSSTNSLMGL
jgi:hypothetical protein